MQLNQLLEEKQKIQSQYDALNEQLAPISKKLFAINKEIELIEFQNNLPLTPEKICKLYMDDFERFPEQYKTFLKQFNFISLSGFSSENLITTFFLYIQKNASLKEIMEEANQFFPHLSERTFSIRPFDGKQHPSLKLKAVKIRYDSSTTITQYLGVDNEGTCYVLNSDRSKYEIIGIHISLEKAIITLLSENNHK